MTPDHRDIVEQVNREFPELLRANTLESCGRFTRLCAARLHARDPNWGLLTKRPGQTQYEGHAVDAIIYRTSQQVVDIITAAHNPPHPGTPAWTLVDRDPSNNWALPDGGSDTGASPATPTNLGPLEQGLAALRAEHAALRGESDALRAELQALRAEMQAIRAELQASIAEVQLLKNAWNQPWRVSGSTSRDAYHAHRVDLVVSREADG